MGAKVEAEALQGRVPVCDDVVMAHRHADGRCLLPQVAVVVAHRLCAGQGAHTLVLPPLLCVKRLVSPLCGRLPAL